MQSTDQKSAEDAVKKAKAENRDLLEIHLLKLKRDLIKIYSRGK